MMHRYSAGLTGCQDWDNNPVTVYEASEHPEGFPYAFKTLLEEGWGFCLALANGVFMTQCGGYIVPLEKKQ